MAQEILNNFIASCLIIPRDGGNPPKFAAQTGFTGVIERPPAPWPQVGYIIVETDDYVSPSTDTISVQAVSITGDGSGGLGPPSSMVPTAARFAGFVPNADPNGKPKLLIQMVASSTNEPPFNWALADIPLQITVFRGPNKGVAPDFG